ncbi:glycerophosphodiester phosphodiesterase [Saccharopolyspora dendranthemae]|uniref:Glycerophosphoryl diester phosphodiesterase n=1 Tax=Saccharopolyspora dendranthemae TaxID=1181886 RepID=A0A561U581_9PSEU|nr:glycerophosphodiester phosphodiesterase family protein [Saccharopolyspora dendranthemae]TWF94515.1 glycerophosphoryl diester phosphodiesterase [Saccharopolyspora dendranthemae]
MAEFPEVVAHRGASAHRAEHTRSAYELALEQGADALECDVRVTQDGHLVCVHDRRIDRTSTGRGVVSALTIAAMSEVDFGRSAAEYGVLTLDELLGMVRANPRPTRLFVETKHPVRYGGLVEHKLVALLARHGLAAPGEQADSPVFMMSFASAAVRRFKEAAPRVPTVLLFSRFTGVRRGGVLPPWADLAGPDVRLLREDPGFVARAAALGRDTYCWTVDEPDDIDLCRRAGVRHIATNSPEATRFHLADPDRARFGSVTG